ncbi:ATP-dependent endonuclease [Pedobacter sp. MR2016-19]|uniref:ATP-dependent nuclease n=1 Tax=Pedobacter sp. MR2016-19 TaxID=2780089 RepID=UPI00187697CD|nr:ATP-dependent endonuclease [Pedobacter sp. MR2016-19]MBE5320841.1 ATP-dependent endonuclease [Pedobacter sp. MR2016-19]
MYIQKIKIENFRLLKRTKVELNTDNKQDLALLIGKNNSGKTSFIMLFDKFFRPEKLGFDFNDFSICLRKNIRGVLAGEDLSCCYIRMALDIAYTQHDNLEHLSDFILDLDPANNVVRLLFECEIQKEELISEVSMITEKYRTDFIEKNLGKFLKPRYYVYGDPKDIDAAGRTGLVEKSIADIRRLINYQVIHAKRNVSSSDHTGGKRTALSELATDYFNGENIFSREAFGKINDQILEMDASLSSSYEAHFKDYFANVKQFVEGKLNVVSNLESKAIMSNYSKIMYGEVDGYLPETFNGLGHLNILFLLLQIEVKRKFFEQEKRNINILFIEEPEAHTHPQMQYVFARKIKEILKMIPNAQTFITSHSSHIVSQCDFEDIRYFKLSGDNVEVRNFHEELEAKYAGKKEHFKFLKQYLTLYASELFFAEKIIFIEGTSEKILLPYFIKAYDELRDAEKDYIPLTSQNVSIIEAGANARVFKHFIEFLGIRTLILTDLDGTKIVEKEKKRTWSACPSNEAQNTSNVTIKYFYAAPNLPEMDMRETEKKELAEFEGWLKQIKEGTAKSISPEIYVAYQRPENGYQARSFEDAFMAINLAEMVTHKDNIAGLENRKELTADRKDYYELTGRVLKSDGKSDLAASILYLALTKEIKWKTPAYIIEGLKWIAS